MALKTSIQNPPAPSKDAQSLPKSYQKMSKEPNKTTLRMPGGSGRRLKGGLDSANGNNSNPEGLRRRFERVIRT